MIKKILQFIKEKIIYFLIGGVALASPVIPVDMEYISSYSFDYETPKEILVKATATSTEKTIIVENDYPFPDSDGDGKGYAGIFKNSNGEEVVVELTKERYESMGLKGGYEFNPTKTEYFNVLKYLTPKVEASIALDSTTTLTQGSATSLTYAHTSTGSNLMLVVGVRTTGTCTGITYNSVSMTQAEFSNGSGGSGINNYIFILPAPATGSNNIVVSMSSSTDIASGAMSYTGVNQSTTPDSTQIYNNSSTNSVTMTFTTVADNCWLVATGDNAGGGYSVGANTVIRYPTGGGNSKFGIDSNGAKTPAGSHSLALTSAGSQAWTLVGVSLAPVAVVSRRIIMIE